MGFYDWLKEHGIYEEKRLPQKPAKKPMRILEREPTPDELAIGHTWGTDAEGEVFKLKGVRQEERNAHFYIVGASRTGKTKLLEWMIRQDIRNGAGFAVIDPHGDFIEAVKGWLLIESKPPFDERVVLLDPMDKNFSVCFNPLELPDGVRPSELANELRDIFEKIWHDAWGSRTDEIFRNTITLLIEHELTLGEFALVLEDDDVRARLTADIKNDVCREFFARYESWDKKTKLINTAPILNKVSTLLSTEPVRDILVSQKSSFNLRQIMEEGKILLVKLDKGKLKTSGNLLGSLILSKIQMAAFARTDMRESERKPFYLYIDEFQNFAEESFKNVLAESAKYQLSLILAHQNLVQLPRELQASILTNCGLQAYFRVARDDAEILAKEAFAGTSAEPTKWEDHFAEIQTLPNTVCIFRRTGVPEVFFIIIPPFDPPWKEAAMSDKRFEDEKKFEALLHIARIGFAYLRNRTDIEEEYLARREALTATDEQGSFKQQKL